MSERNIDVVISAKDEFTASLLSRVGWARGLSFEVDREFQGSEFSRA